MTAELLFSAVVSLMNVFYTVETYWAYGTNSSMLHFVKLKESNILVYVYNSEILISPSKYGHMTIEYRCSGFAV